MQGDFKSKITALQKSPYPWLPQQETFFISPKQIFPQDKKR
jgi:hypothetical protein